jgi:hypothetical protein
MSVKPEEAQSLVCAQLLDAATTAGEITTDMDALVLMLGFGTSASAPKALTTMFASCWDSSPSRRFEVGRARIIQQVAGTTITTLFVETGQPITSGCSRMIS